MKLNYESTRRILEALGDLFDTSRVRITTENTDYKGQVYHADDVTLESAHHIGFENFGSEIIVYYFNDHIHFQDEDMEGNATAFLRRIFTTPLVQVETFKGNRRIRYEWFFLESDGRRTSAAGACFERVFTNPFRKKRLERTFWRYHRGVGTFVQITDDTASLHSFKWDILIHIRRVDNAYTFALERYYFDEEGTQDFYWAPVHIPGVSFYDTEEKALAAAKDAAKAYCKENPHRSPFKE